jgi:hypothetical protein
LHNITTGLALQTWPIASRYPLLNNLLLLEHFILSPIMNHQIITSSQINGHFDPFSLSIGETTSNSGWRNRVRQIFDQEKLGLMVSYAKLEKTRQLADGISDKDLLSELTSRHEQRHFKDYASSEIGLLITFILQLRADVISSYIHTNHEPLLSYFPIYNTIIESFYGPDRTQQEAVDALNSFYTHELSISDHRIFKTDTPDAPSSPHPYFRFQNIIEASAVLSEISLILGLCGNNQAARVLSLLRFDAREADIYFGLIVTLYAEIPSYSAISMLIRYCLDSRVPILGSPFQGCIDWHDFHPGYRLLNFTRSLKEILKAEGLDFASLEKQDFEVEYSMKLQQIFLHYTHYAGKHLGKLDMWDNDSIANYEMNGELLLCKLSERAQEKARMNFDQWDIIMDHLYESHNTYKNARKNNALLFYTDSIVSQEVECIKIINSSQQSAHSYALFTIIDGEVGSIQKNPSWVKAFFRLVEYEITELIMDGMSKQSIYNQIILKYKVLVSTRLHDEYINRLKKIIYSYCI